MSTAAEGVQEMPAVLWDAVHSTCQSPVQELSTEPPHFTVTQGPDPVCVCSACSPVLLSCLLIAEHQARLKKSEKSQIRF